MDEQIKILNWDSNLFGYKVACLDLQDINSYSYSSLKQHLVKNNIKLLYIFTEPSEENTEFKFENVGAVKVDEKVTYHKFITGKSQDNLISGIVPYNSPLVSENLLSLALQSGIHSRFNTDKHFTNNEFFKLYSKWIERSVKGEIANQILVFVESGKEGGMITLRINRNIGSIGLFAVDKQMRGKSVGTKLVKAAEKYFYDNNVREIFVTTQNNNFSACKFYETCDFKAHTRKFVYHLWL